MQQQWEPPKCDSRPSVERPQIGRSQCSRTNKTYAVSGNDLSCFGYTDAHICWSTYLRMYVCMWERERERERERWLLSRLKLKELYLLCRGNEVISRGAVFVGNTRTFGCSHSERFAINWRMDGQ